MSKSIEEQLIDLLNKDHMNEAIHIKDKEKIFSLIDKINPLEPTSDFSKKDKGYPSLMGYAVQKNLPDVVDAMFKNINMECKNNRDLIDREFYGLCFFNNDDKMWDVFLKNVKKIKVTTRINLLSSLDVLFKQGQRKRIRQIVDKVPNNELDHIHMALNSPSKYFKKMSKGLYNHVSKHGW